nr:hypothetical protein [uncultured Massilia sp.]
MSETLTPAKSAPTTTPRNTHVEVTHSTGEGVYLYRPEDNALIALYPDEWRDCRQEAHENKVVIEELQKAKKSVNEQSQALQELLRQPNAAKQQLAQAQQDLDKALEVQAEKSDAAKKRIEPITDQKTDPGKIVELLPLTLKRTETSKAPIYISAKRLQAALADKRIYLINGEAERAKPNKEKLFNGAALNVKEAKRRLVGHVQDQVKFEKKWKLAPEGADQYAGILTEWAEVMGTTATACLERGAKDITEGILKGVNSDPDSPQRMIDIKPEAQFMRWAGGAGLEANFKPAQGNMFVGRDKTAAQKAKRVGSAAQGNLNANIDLSFAIGEAKIETSVYLPHAAGWNLKPGHSDLSLNFGYFRLRGDVKLYAMAGASIALEASASLMVSGGKQTLKGTTKHKAGVNAKVGVKAEAKVFAGLKEGIALSGTLQWLNPEGFTDANGPKKVDINKVLAEYVDMAKLGIDAAIIQGLSASRGFECEYRNGKFVIAAKASSCLGLGGEGNFAAEVNAAEIGQFLMFVAHQLKQADYKKLAFLIGQSSFFLLNQMLYLHVAAGKKITDFVGQNSLKIRMTYDAATSSIGQRGVESIKKLEKQLKTGWGWYAYMPPEARGALISSIANIVNAPENIKNLDLRKIAAFSVNELIATIQTQGHFVNTMDRVTTVIGEKTDRNQSIKTIESIVKNTPFDGCINRCETGIKKSSPLLGRPFLRNDEAEFTFSKFPLHHINYINSNKFLKS